MIAGDDGGIIDYDRAGGLLESITALYALAGVAKLLKPIHCLRQTFGAVTAPPRAAGQPAGNGAAGNGSTNVISVDEL